MLQQNIFGSKIYLQKLANFRIDDKIDLAAKTEIIAKYIKALDSGKIERTKEESIQADFMNKFFGDILGYDYTDPTVWNLEKEFKSITDGTKSDGALGFFKIEGKTVVTDVRATIELKDALTDLDKPQNRVNDRRTPVEQAFSYASKVGGRCKWVIVSNFREVRLYHASDQSKYEIFVLNQMLNQECLKRFFFLMHRDRLISMSSESEIDILYRERQEHEQTITKIFYTEYKIQRIELFEHIKLNNPGKDELMILTKTQKLLDRFIFICFCENASLLPPNTLKKIKDIINNAFDLEKDKLWRQLKGLFHSIDLGNPGMDINKFNGGLFRKDDELDNFTIRDEVLLKMIKLSENDFSSDLNVNILGHIFEQSISDIEVFKARIGNGKSLHEEAKQEVRKNGKRKKDGIFYTPEFITRSIVNEAIGGWLDDCKNELGFYNLPDLTKADFASVHTVRRKSKETGKMYEALSYNLIIEKHIHFWESYKERLLQIKVLDPACGSGAFLNQAFDFLYTEGRKVNDELSLLRAGQLEVFELDRHILTNNLFGVDINPESVEITKLSLWLKTANKGKELAELDENIKCGNSLVDDPTVSHNHAFNWFIEFPNVFPNHRKHYEIKDKATLDFVEDPSYNYKNPDSKGFIKHGFDVIIGNPPWGAYLDQVSSNYLLVKYPVIPGKIKDTYLYFTLLAISLLKNNGYLGFVIPNTWLLINNAKGFREFLLQFKVKKIIDYGDNVFSDAIVECTTLIVKKFKDISADCETIRIKNGIVLFNNRVDKNIWLRDDLARIVLNIDFNSQDIIKRIESHTEPFYLNNDIIFGIKPYQVGHGVPAQTRKDVTNRIYHSDVMIDSQWFPLVTGTDVTRYHLQFKENAYIKYGKWLMYPSNEQKIKGPKILLRRTSSDLKATYDEHCYYPQNSIFIITSNRYHLKYLLVLLNSKLMDYLYKQKCPQVGKIFAEVKPSIIKSLPIPALNPEQQLPFIELADFMLSKNKKLFEHKNIFIQFIQSKWPGFNVSTKLSNWPSLSFNGFITELAKQKIMLSLLEQSEWLKFFDIEKRKAEDLQSTISQTDNTINNMVYDLYQLNLKDRDILQ
ncbi:MAG: TaqI-like C-terminal specificity domain-containing protein [Bacteroidales bacterium]|nr:TaqI-like C-terminal specificity domain-containing protein [Bacteroidales bacterium]